MTIKPLGEHGLILEVKESQNTLEALLAYRDHLLKENHHGITSIIPCYHTLTIIFDPLYIEREKVIEILHKTSGEKDLFLEHNTRIHRIPVCYEDKFSLDILEVAKHNQLSIEEVISIHYSSQYRVMGMGFSPGFGYLSGLPNRIHAPRLKSPRKVVPAGAVGIAGKQTAIYPSATPGGWNLIGQSPIKLIDYFLGSPLLRIGDHIEFYPITSKEFYAW